MQAEETQKEDTILSLSTGLLDEVREIRRRLESSFERGRPDTGGILSKEDMPSNVLDEAIITLQTAWKGLGDMREFLMGTVIKKIH